jgi:hypothetical protein
MLEDIVKITSTLLMSLYRTNKSVKPQHAYDVYRALVCVLGDIAVVSEHYLALDFTQDYLQNSHMGEPADKWRNVFNADLERLNGSLRDYLYKLNRLCWQDESECFYSFMDKLYESKIFYAFIRDTYNVGYVKPCSFEMVSTILKTGIKVKDFYIAKHRTTDLSTYEQRIALQKDVRAKNKLLLEQCDCLQDYIKTNYTIDDLL